MNSRGNNRSDTTGGNSVADLNVHSDTQVLKSKRDQRAEESNRILARVEKETTAQSHGFLTRQMHNQLSHLKAEDIEDQDKIELWATKIGRFLGLVITLGIIAWLIIYLIQSQFIS